MSARKRNTPLRKSEIEKMQQNLNVLEAEVDNLSNNLYDMHSEVFNSSFMRKYTLQYESFGMFIQDSPSELESDVLREIDLFVIKNTLFDDWNEMKQKGIEEWIATNASLN